MTTGLTNLYKVTDTTIKQGDTSSTMGFKLSTRDGKALNGPAKLQLVNSQGHVHEQMVDVVDNQFDLKLSKILPADIYIIEVEIDGYIFPSAKDRTVTVRENLGEDGQEVQELKRLDIKDEVDKYLQAHESGQIDLNRVVAMLEGKLPSEYDDSALRAEIKALKEQSVQYDDSELREAIRGLSERLDGIANYDDTDINQRLNVLESKTDQDTVYDDSDVRSRLNSLSEQLATVQTTPGPQGPRGPEGPPGSDATVDLSPLEAKIAMLESELLTAQTTISELTAQASRPAAAEVKDTGWLDITEHIAQPLNGSLLAGAKVIYRRIGNQVWLSFSNFGYTAANTQQNWLDDRICSYSCPPEFILDGRRSQLRMGNAINTGDHVGRFAAMDWLSQTNLRLTYTTANIFFHGTTSWLTDKTFPESPLGTKL